MKIPLKRTRMYSASFARETLMKSLSDLIGVP